MPNRYRRWRGYGGKYRRHNNRYDGNIITCDVDDVYNGQYYQLPNIIILSSNRPSV